NAGRMLQLFGFGAIKIYSSSNMSLPEHIGQPADGEPDYMAPSITAKLTDFQFAWLLTQSLELKTSRAQILGGVVSEWLNQHPHTQRDQVCAGDFIREALDKFIVSHAAEFMPVAFPERIWSGLAGFPLKIY